MKRTVDWPNHLINFVLIVLSILMAFQLEKIDKLTEDQFQLDTLLQLIHTEDSDTRRINGLVFRMMNVGGLYVKKNAYASFTESGDIRFLDDFEKKSELIELYEYYKLAEVQNLLPLFSNCLLKGL